MIRRPAVIAAIALAISIGGGAAVLAQTSGDYGSNAGNHEASGAGTDGNVVVSNGRRGPSNIPAPVRTPTGAAPTATAAAGGTSSGGVVIPPNPALNNPALTGQGEPGALAPTITEETTSGESVLGPTPTPLPAQPQDDAVTADDSADSGSGGNAATTTGHRTGDAAVSAEDGTTTGGTVNTNGAPAARPTIPSGSSGGAAGAPGSSGSSGSVSRPSRGACGYPTWLDAQTALETQWTVELADALDPDRDGIACEESMN